MRRHPARFVAYVIVLVALTSLLVGCGASAVAPGELGDPGEVTYRGEIEPGDPVEGDDGDDTADGPLVAADDSEAASIGHVAQTLVASGKLRATANVNLRKGAATTYAVLAVIPSGSVVTVLDTAATNGFVNIVFNGTAGWSSAAYFADAGTPEALAPAAELNGPASPDNAVARARKAVGFSYYWGGGAWLAAGVSSGTAGSCSGSCPSCSHSGKYGADCSGLVAKAWQLGTKALEVNSHPYSTASFNGSSSSWSTVSRSSLRKGDALVYNTSGHGHMVLYEKGDAWGTPTVIECRGCSYGCVYNARSFTSSYKGIRRAGF